MKEEKKTIETELKEARARLQYLLAVSPAIIYTTQVSGDYACTFVSENLHAILGYTPEEMVTDPKFWGTRLHPEDAPRVFDEVFPLIERGGGTLEYRVQHREGHYLWFQDTFKVIHDEAGRPSEIVGSWADINDRKRAEEALRESEEHYRAVIENVADAIVINVGTNRVFVNKAFLKLHGLDDVSQVLGMPLDQFIVPEDRQLVSERTLARQRGQSTLTSYDEWLAKALPRLSRKVLAETTQKLQTVKYAAGDMVFNEGDSPDSFYILVSGEAEVFRRLPGGEEKTLTILEPGDYFGEIGLLTEARRTAAVRAKSSLELLALDWDGFRKVVESSEESGADFAEIVRQRLARG